jgi:hypothetical protein
MRIEWRDVEDPTLSRQSALRWQHCCQPYAPHASTPPETLFFSASGTHLCLRPNKLQDLVRPEGLGKLKKFIQLIISRTRDHTAYSIMP